MVSETTYFTLAFAALIIFVVAILAWRALGVHDGAVGEKVVVAAISGLLGLLGGGGVSSIVAGQAANSAASSAASSVKTPAKQAAKAAREATSAAQQARGATTTAANQAAAKVSKQVSTEVKRVTNKRRRHHPQRRR
jgi:gas vesicle protein